MSNDDIVIKSASVLLSGARSEHVALETSLYEIPQKGGHVFGLFEIQHKDENARNRLFHVLKSHLEHLATDLTGDGSAPRRFEAMLARLNADLTRAMSEERLSRTKMKAVVGVMTDTQVFLSGSGDIRVLFLHRTAERRYVVYELDEQFRNAQGEDDNGMFFVTVLDGELKEGDVFYIGLRISGNALPPSDLQDVLITLPPAGALERIQQFVPVGERFGALCFHASEPQLETHKKANPTSSVVSFNETTERTAEILGEQGSDLATGFRAMAENAKKRLRAPGTSGTVSVLRRMLRVAIDVVLRIVMFLTALVRFCAPLVARAYRKLRDRGVPALSLSRAVTHVKRFSRTQKVLALALAVLVITFTVSLIAVRGSSAQRAAEKSRQETIALIESKRIAADAALIYKNTNDARSALNDAATLLATLPIDTKAHTDDVNRLRADLDGVLAKIRGSVAVSPTTLATLGQNELPFLQSVAVGTGTYAVRVDGSVFKLNEVASAFDAVSLTRGTFGDIRLATAYDADAILVDVNKHLVRVSLGVKSENPVPSGAEGMASVDALVAYNGALYVLSASAEQIVKMRPQGDGFEAGTTWVTARNTDLTSARALAIDGSVYVLTSNNFVRFTSGHEDGFVHDPIDPALVNPVALWTSTDTKYLYILDAGNGRVIVFNKETGGLVKQYTSDTFTGAVGMTIDESHKRILIVTPRAVLQFSPEHLL